MLKELGEVFQGSYVVRPLTKVDIPAILKLYRSNGDYYALSQNNPVSEEDCIHDMTECPPGISAQQKYYLGFHQNENLAAILDVVDGYPEAGTVYIGLFIIDGAYHGRGTGLGILSPFLSAMKSYGCRKAALGCFEKNAAGKKFWTKLGFDINEIVDRTEGPTLRRLMKMSRAL